MHQYIKLTLIVFATVTGSAILLLIFTSLNGIPPMSDILASFGIYYICCSPLLFLIGIIMLCISSKRPLGLAILTVVALVLIVGFSLCSMHPIKI